MPRKNQLTKFQNITNGDMTTTITSPATAIHFLDDIGVQFNFTGVPVGTFQVQVSIDYTQDQEGNIEDPGHWISIALSPSPVAAGAAGQVYVDLNMLSSPWVRVVYVPTSGSGTLNAFITGKEV